MSAITQVNWDRLMKRQPAFANDVVPELDAESTEDLGEYAPTQVVDDILLSMIDGVGAVTSQKLYERFGTATRVLDAPLSELKDCVSARLAQSIADAREEIDALAVARFCEENDIKVLTLADARYPARLRPLSAPPRLLYVRGDILPQDVHAISIVGTRHATRYGIQQATLLARSLAELGFTIVSGLALGIDGSAHRGALDVGGRTFACLGSGVARIYPTAHEDLAGRVVQNGALISEYHPLMEPLSGNFPARNRIVSGLSLGVLVVESDVKGGSMITARIAAEQNREVFAVPGLVTSNYSRGCHQLIREGAALVETAEDVIAALPHYERPLRAPIPAEESAPGALGISASSIASISRRKDPSEKKSRGAKSSKKGESNSDERQLSFDMNRPVSVDESSKSEAKNESSSPDASEAPASSAPLPAVALSPDERRIVDLIGETEVHVDDVIRGTGLPTARVIALIAGLEFKQVLIRLQGNVVSRAK